MTNSDRPENSHNESPEHRARKPRRPYSVPPPDAKTNLRQLRQARGWTLPQVAEQLGCRAANVQRWETTGRVDVDTLYKLAAVYGVTPAELLPGPSPLASDEETLLELYRLASPARRPDILTLAEVFAHESNARRTVREENNPPRGALARDAQRGADAPSIPFANLIKHGSDAFGRLPLTMSVSVRLQPR